MRLVAGCVVVWLAQAVPQPVVVADLDGRPVDPLRAEAGVRATVLVFARTDCPLANQAAPEIERVRRQYAGRGVRLWVVFVDPAEPAERIRAHLAEYGVGAAAVRDPGHELVGRTGVRVTPEAAVYVHDAGGPRLVYRGRLDDRVAALGRAKPRATRFDLREAVDLALSGTAPVLRVTPAAGCEIADLR